MRYRPTLKKHFPVLLVIAFGVITYYFFLEFHKEFSIAEKSLLLPVQLTAARVEEKYDATNHVLQMAKASIEVSFLSEENLISEPLSALGVKTFEDIDVTPSLRRELSQIINQKPVLKRLFKTRPNTTRVYYTSLRGFQYTFPYSTDTEWQYDSTVFTRSYFKNATPEQNKNQTVFWTEPYLDSAKSGLVMTASVPIYNQHQFSGVLSLDLTLKDLATAISDHDFETHNAIVTTNGILIVHSDISYEKLTELPTIESTTPSEIITIGDITTPITRTKGWTKYTLPLEFRKSFLVSYTSHKQILIKTTKAMTDDIIIIIAIALLFIQIHVINKKDQKLQKLALYDKLTSLPNRNLLFETLNTTIAFASRREATFSILFIDLNYFKKANDTYGHAAGDAILKEFGKRLKESVRSSDTAARLAGDEFVVILRDSSGDETSHEIPRIRNKIDGDLSWNNKKLTIESSIGYAVFPHDGKSAEELISAADSRMYQDKPKNSR